MEGDSDLEHFVRFMRTSLPQAWIDLRERWLRACTWLFFAGLCTCLDQLYMYIQAPGRAKTACPPDGSFRLDPETFSYWSKEGFFQITLGFGKLSFTAAKVVDVVWDVCFGRGGQALIALISWKVFIKYITTVLETAPVTFRTYRIIFWQDPSFLAIPRIVHDFSFRLSIHSRLAMTFMVSTMIFISAFPTLGSAMTGYVANVQAFVNVTDGNLVPFNTFLKVCFIIHDGHRINQTDEFLVPCEVDTMHDDPVVIYGSNYPRNSFSGEWDLSTTSYIYAYYNTTHYNNREKNETSNFTLSTNKPITLAPPLLNITTLWGMSYYLSGRLQYTDLAWMYSNESYNLDYIRSYGSCQTLTSYRWGFSFIQLNLMIIFLITWTLGMVIMWLSADETMTRRCRNQVAGEYTAVLELANAMQSQLRAISNSSSETDTANMAESELRHRIVQDLRGGAISYKAPLLSSEGSNRSKVGWEYVKVNIWWLVALVMSAAASMTMGVFGGFPSLIFLLGISVALIVAISVGSTHGSKLIIMWWCFWALVVLPQVIVLAVLGPKLRYI